jgi:hypothetical protein
MPAAAAGPADNATEATPPAAVSALAIATASARLKRIYLLLQMNDRRRVLTGNSTALDNMFKHRLSAVCWYASALNAPGKFPASAPEPRDDDSHINKQIPAKPYFP